MAVKDINQHPAILPKHDIILDILGRRPLSTNSTLSEGFLN